MSDQLLVDIAVRSRRLTVTLSAVLALLLAGLVAAFVALARLPVRGTDTSRLLTSAEVVDASQHDTCVKQKIQFALQDGPITENHLKSILSACKEKLIKEAQLKALTASTNQKK